jgi:hypothetical protein
MDGPPVDVTLAVGAQADSQIRTAHKQSQKLNFFMVPPLNKIICLQKHPCQIQHPILLNEFLETDKGIK